MNALFPSGSGVVADASTRRLLTSRMLLLDLPDNLNLVRIKLPLLVRLRIRSPRRPELPTRKAGMHDDFLNHKLNEASSPGKLRVRVPCLTDGLVNGDLCQSLSMLHPSHLCFDFLKRILNDCLRMCQLLTVEKAGCIVSDEIIELELACAVLRQEVTHFWCASFFIDLCKLIRFQHVEH